MKCAGGGWSSSGIATLGLQACPAFLRAFRRSFGPCWADRSDAGWRAGRCCCRGSPRWSPSSSSSATSSCASGACRCATGPRAGAARAAAAGSLRPGARGRPAHDQHAALRRADPRRHRHVPPLDRRDADRRRQDADGHAAAVPARPAGQGLPPGHGQRLPGPPRRRVDGADLRGAGPDAWAWIETADVAAAAAQGLRLRRHLRHGQGVRLRLPPRPAAAAADRRRADRPAGRHAGHRADGAPTRSPCSASPTSPWSTRPTAS